MQRLAEWRNGISKSALEVLEEYFHDEEMTETEIAQYVTSQLSRGLPFVSQSTTFDPASGIPVSITTVSVIDIFH